MQLFFIRHGESANNRLYRETKSYEGRDPDPVLTELGRRQANALAHHLAAQREDYDLTHIYTSLMVRAIATATPVAEALDLPLVGWPDLHERGGVFERNEETLVYTGLPGNSREYFVNHHPTLVVPDDLDGEGWWNRPHEPLEDVTPRAERVVQALLERHDDTDDRVAIVSHGGFFNHLMHVILNLSYETAPWFVMHNTGITCVSFGEDETAIIYVNRLGHLAGVG